MTGYQETVTDPSFAEQLVCFTAPMVGNYGVAAGRAESTGAHAKAVLMREARGPEWTDMAAGARDRRADRDRHALARAPPPRGRRDASRRGRDSARTRQMPSQPSSRSPEWRVARSSPRCRRRTPYVYCDAGDDPRRSRRLRRQAVDSPAARGRRRRGHMYTHVPPTPTSSQATTPFCSRTAPATPSRSSTRSRSCASCSAASRSSGSASATSCSGSRPATRPTSSRSATAAPTTRCSRGRAAASSSRARTTASRSRPSDDAEATHVSLYDGTVEGFDFPELNARSVQFHPEAGPGPHDAWPILESWVEEVRDAAA